jgi:ABC-2 type transport system ATP-binding protein
MAGDLQRGGFARTFGMLLLRWRIQAYMDLMWMTRDAKLCLINVVSDVILNLLGVMAVFLLAERFDGIGVSTREQTIFMLGYAALVRGILVAGFGYNILQISRRVGRGQMDHVLIQPQPIWMILLTEGFMPFSGCLSLFTGIGITAWSLTQLSIPFVAGWGFWFFGHLVASTTVKLLSSALAPTSGTVRALGMDPLKDLVNYVRRIGVVFGQRTELWWDQPVSASFEWARVVWDVPRDRYEATLGFVKELLGLEPFFNSLARQLSLGQKMRADLGLMLMHEPEVLFLDEPTIGVDVLGKRNIRGFIKTLNEEKGVTVMVTSHDMDDLEQLAGRIVMIDGGRIAFDGDFGQLRSTFGDRRHLMLETPEVEHLQLENADWVKSEGNRHAYTFDAAQTSIPALLDQAARHTSVSDVETHRAPIDDVIADMYEGWEGKS